MDNIIVKITAQSDMSDATKDFDSLKQKEAEILQGMEALKKKQAEFQGAPKVISLLDAEYKKLEKDLKATQTSMSGFAASQKKVNDTVADGAIKHTSLRSQIAQMREELSRMEMAGQDSSKAYIDLSVQAGKLQDQMGDTRQTIQVLSSDTRALDTAMGLGRGLAGGFSAATSAAALLGGENEELTKAFLKVQAAMSILNGVQEVADMLNKNSVVMVNLRTAAENSSTLSKIKGYAATLTLNATTAVQTGLESKNVVVKGASTVAQWALNTAVLAFPAVAIIAAITAIVAGFAAYSSNASEAERAQAKLNAEVDNFNADMEERNKITDYTTEAMKAQGKTSEEIRAYEKKRAEDNLKYAKQQLATIQENENATEEQLKAAKEAVIKYQSDVVDLQRKHRIDLMNEDKTANEKKSAERKQADEDAKERAKENASYMLDISKQLEDSKIAVMKDGVDKQVALIELEYSRKIAVIKGNSAKEIALRESLEREKQQKIAAITKVEALKGEKLAGDGVLKVFEKGEKNKSEAAKKSGDIIANINKSIGEKTQEEIKNEADRIKQKEDDKVAVTQASAQAIGDIGNLLFEGAAEKRQIEMDDLYREYSAKIEAAEGNAALQKRLEDELAAKKLEIRIKQAKADKAQAVFNIGLSTAQAIIGMLANPGGVAGIALSVIAGITGAAQITAALAKPLPKYAKGKKAGGGGHFATVGELGAETMWIPDNAAVIPHNRKMNFDTFKDFGIPIEMDSKWMRSADIDYDKLGASVGKHVKIPTPKPVTVHVDKSGVAVDYSGNKTTFLNKKYQGSWN